MHIYSPHQFYIHFTFTHLYFCSQSNPLSIPPSVQFPLNPVSVSDSLQLLFCFYLYPFFIILSILYPLLMHFFPTLISVLISNPVVQLYICYWQSQPILHYSILSCQTVLHYIYSLSEPLSYSCLTIFSIHLLSIIFYPNPFCTYVYSILSVCFITAVASPMPLYFCCCIKPFYYFFINHSYTLLNSSPHSFIQYIIHFSSV